MTGGTGGSSRPVRPLLLGEGWFPDHPGGLNRYMAELYPALQAQGLGARAVVTGPLTAAPAGVEAAVPRTRPLARRLWGFARAASNAAGDADLVDVHFALYGAASLLTAGVRRRPLAVHFHGPWAEESAAAGQTSRLALAAKRALERFVYRRADEVVVLSSAFKQVLVERYGILPWPVTVIPPGVDLDRFTPGSPLQARQRLGIDPGARVALTVRRLVPRMGIDVLLDAWAEVAPGRDDALLLVVGEGPERVALEKQAAARGLAATVRFLGAVDDEQLVDAYRAADVCVVPSVSLEGYGLVVLEALASGTPVIVTAVGGLPEAVAGLEPAAVVPPGDHRRLAARLGATLGDAPGDAPGRSDADACRRHAEAFTWERAAARHRTVYTRLCRPKAARRPRVVYLDHCAQPSGGELALLRLLPALDVDAHVVLGEDGPLVGRLLQLGLSVEVLPMAAAAAHLRRDRVSPGGLPLAGTAQAALYVGRLAARLRRLRPDLVHTNSLKAAIYGGLAARAVRTPCLWHVRDRVAADYLPAAAVHLVRAAARRLPAAVLVNSAATRDALLGGRAPGSLPVRVVHDPYRPRRPAAAGGDRGPGMQPGPLRVGMIGRLAPWKGQDLFLSAFAEAFPDGAAEAVIVGSPLFGEDAYAEGLRRQADQLGLDGRVRFAGFVDDVEGELAALDVLVHASVIPEPFGQVVVEGMAAGLPVLAPAAGGPAEVITHEREGLLYPVGDVAALAGCLRRIAADPGLRWRLGGAGRRRAADFEPENLAGEVMTLYQSLLNPLGRGARGATD